MAETAIIADTIDDAALYMSQHCVDDLKGFTYYNLGHPLRESFAALLSREPALHTRLKAVRGSTGIEGFWAFCRGQYQQLSSTLVFIEDVILYRENQKIHHF